MTNEIHIATADDHPLIRKRLRRVIEADSTLRVVAEAGDGDHLISQIETSRPQIAIVDVGMPKKDGFAVLKELSKTKLPVDVVFLTIHNEEEFSMPRWISGSRAMS